MYVVVSSSVMGRSSTIKNSSNGGGSPRRGGIVKRRYKSGIPLSSDRSDTDSVEEVYLKSFYDSVVNKVGSKDDSDITLGGMVANLGGGGVSGENLYSSIGGVISDEFNRAKMNKGITKSGDLVDASKNTKVNWF